MANPNIQIDVGGNTARLERDINKVASRPISIDLTATRGASAPLGRITGDIAEIDKSLAAANARVVAFAASAGVIYGLESAVRSLITTFVNVEKRLADVNVLLNLSNSELSSFGSSLFSIAGSTAQSFDTVAEAATELARQGLGVEETLKRTNDALVLTRLSGLDAASSVKALTAAINSFSDAGLTSTEIINKLANVDAAFAVSSADLANAISRVGSSASDAGVSFDELIALVTTAQQVTSRGGAVIGNSLKTIFTRLGRGETQDLLKGLGVSVTDESGAVKNQVQLLQDLAKIYDTLPQLQKNLVAEQVGGVFQINVLKAALGDLGKEYSIYNQALETSITSTDEATKRNEKLNQTLAARGAKALTDIQQAGITIAEPLFKPLASNVLNISDLLTGAVNNADTSSIGAKIGRGLLEGIGNFIGGPGLALITAALGKLFAQFSKVGVEAFKSILGTNTAAKEQAAIQANIAQYLQQNAGLYSGIQKGQLSVSQAAQQYLGVIQQQTQALQQQAAVAQQIAALVGKNLTIQSAGGKSLITPKGTKLFSGFIPNFADPNAMAEIAGAKAYGYKPGKVVKERIYDGTGKSFMAYRNLAETRTDFINSDGKKATMIAPPNGFSKDTMTAFSGFVPNFALYPKPSDLRRQLNNKNLTDKERASIKQKLQNLKGLSINLGQYSNVGSKYGLLFAQDGAGAGRFSQQIGGPDTPAALKPLAKAGVKGSVTAALRYRSIYPPDKGAISSGSQSYANKIDAFLQPGFENLAADIAANLGGAVSANPDKLSSILPAGAKGTIFEKAVSAATRKPGKKMDSNLNDRAPFDFDPITSYPLLNQLFGKNIGSAVEAKIGKAAAGNIPNKILNKEPSIAKRILNEYMPKAEKAYAGYIPNFAESLQQAIDNERAAGISSGSIYLSQEKELKKANQLGIGVFNKKDEPNRMARKSAMAKKGFSSGYIPNFAEGSGLSGMDMTMIASSIAMSMAMMQNGADTAGATFKGFVKDFKLGKGEFLKGLNQGGIDISNSAEKIQSARKSIVDANRILQSPTMSLAGRAKAEDIIDRNQETIRQEKIKTRIAPRVGKYSEAIKSRGLGVGFAGQALGGVASQLLGGPETKGGATASALGNIAGFAGMGAMFGIKGAAVGAAVGALTSLPDVINAFDSELQNTIKAAESASKALNSFQTGSQQFLQATSNLSNIQSQEVVDPVKLKKGQNDFYTALSKLPVEFQNQIQGTDFEKAQETVAKYNERLIQDAKVTELSKTAAQGLGGFFSDDTKKAGDIGKSLSGLIGVADESKSLEEQLAEYNSAVAKAKGAQEQYSNGVIGLQDKIDSFTPDIIDKNPVFSFGKKLGSKAADYLLPDMGITPDQQARDIFKNTVEQMRAEGKEIPQSIKDFLKDGLSSASAEEIKAQTQGLLDGLAERIEEITNALKKKEAQEAAIKRLSEAEQEYIANIGRSVSQSTADTAFQFNTQKLEKIDIPKFGLETERFAEDFLSQFRNSSSFIGKIDPLKRVQEDFTINKTATDLGGVESFMTSFLPTLNEEFLKMQASGNINPEDVTAIGAGLENLRKNIASATRLEDLSTSGDYQGFLNDFYSNSQFTTSGSAVDPVKVNSVIKTAFEQSFANAANEIKSQKVTLDLEQQKAQVQASLNQSIAEFQTAMSNLDALPRADLTGFTNPFREAAQTRANLINEYNKSDEEIKKQYEEAMAQAQKIENPTERNQTIDQITKQKNEALKGLQSNFDKSLKELAEQVDVLEESAAREAVGFAIAGGADSDTINRAIDKYFNSIQDRIQAYAEYLGVSTQEVERLMKAKMQKDSGMIPDDLKPLADNIQRQAEQGKQLDVKLNAAGEGINKFLGSIPNASTALTSLQSAALNAASRLNSIPAPRPATASPQGNASGFIPNFAGGFVSGNKKFNTENIAKSQEKAMAREYGYIPGQVREETIWNGSGESTKGVVNGAEDVINFRNSRGYKSTMVVPPNFASGYTPNGNSGNFNSFNKNLNSADTGIKYFTSSVKQAANAIGKLNSTPASENNTAPQQQGGALQTNTATGPTEQTLKLSNPIVSPNINVKIDGLGGVDAAIGEIKNTLISKMEGQASRINFLSEQLRDLKFQVAKKSI